MMFVSSVGLVIVANEPRWLRDMLARVLDKVVGLQTRTATADPAGVSRMVRLVRSAKPDWVVLTLSPDGELPSEAGSLTEEQPSLGVIGIAGDGGCVKLQRNGFVSETIRDFSLKELAVLIRQDSAGHSYGEAA